MSGGQDLLGAIEHVPWHPWWHAGQSPGQDWWRACYMRGRWLGFADEDSQPTGMAGDDMGLRAWRNGVRRAAATEERP